MSMLTTTWWSWCPGKVWQVWEQTWPFINPKSWSHCLSGPFLELCSTPESPRLRNSYESIRTNQRWSSALTNPLMRFGSCFATCITITRFLLTTVLICALAFIEWIRLPADVQRQSPDRLSSLLRELDGVEWWASSLLQLGIYSHILVQLKDNYFTNCNGRICFYSSSLIWIFHVHVGIVVPLLPGMPDFLEKLHNAALRAKNLEVGIHDYAGVIKSSDRQPSQERLSGENSHTGGSGQIYAWGRHRRVTLALALTPYLNRPANLWVHCVAKWSCCLH